jgi:RND superfamily putative drug exporter
MREEYVRSGDPRQAVHRGFGASSGVVTAAALIMTSVFFAFMLNPDRVTKEFGLLLGCAILCDAFLMRMTLVPSLLALLGERSWAMPGWLDKILPNITIEPQVEGDGGGPTPQPAPAAGD